MAVIIVNLTIWFILLMFGIQEVIAEKGKDTCINKFAYISALLIVVSDNVEKLIEIL